MNKSERMKVVSLFTGLMLFMLLTQTTFALGNQNNFTVNFTNKDNINDSSVTISPIIIQIELATGNAIADNIATGNTLIWNATDENISIGNTTDENISIGNTTDENISIENATDENISIGNTTDENISIGNTTDENISIENATDENISIGNATNEGVTDFLAFPSTGIAPLTVKLTDKSTGSPISWSWNFGDGANSTQENPNHTYSKVGSYSISLTATNSAGNNTTTKSNYIKVVAFVDPVSNLSCNVTPGQTTLPVADFNANATSGYAPLSILFTDTSQNAEARDWDFNNDGIPDSSDAIHVYAYTAPGNYTVNLKVSNTNGTASKTATITILKESDSSGDSSSGGSSSGGSSSDGSSHRSGGNGGAGGSPEPQSNVETKEISQAFVTSGNPVKFDFPRNVTSVIYVSFDSKKTADKTTTIVEMLKGKSTLVSELPSDEVYKFLNIWVGNSGFATPKNIKNAVVCFKVKKSWIQDKKIDQSSIILNRYSNKKWNQLTTSLLNEDYKYLYFTAQTPGFSPFAITGKVIATGNEIQNKLNTGSIATNIKQIPEKKNNTSTSGKETKSTPGFEIAYCLVGLFGVFLSNRK
jgi:PGF-pre-PGF domain-containing protein